MPFLHPDIRDNGLASVANLADLEVHILTVDPADRAAVIENTLGVKSDPAIGEVQDGIDGASAEDRLITVGPVSDGSATATGKAKFWALIDDTKLVAANALEEPQDVTAGNVVTIEMITIEALTAVSA
ncbi:hypothetical protein JCM17845_15550 [Iodidimonas gelatinilytica]|uniref:Uncharacterized protein n=1 Tax=Iodidimonas gelatinilytica TaxID=1236966 RepID=A0A5A7MY67_9PROT|nr:hypothetical protein [Iodidimonas gelatinilytica]GER00932.1 hypothetical protein JCM17845_15550 [Iodidimonas gelatinilytica]